MCRYMPYIWSAVILKESAKCYRFLPLTSTKTCSVLFDSGEQCGGHVWQWWRLQFRYWLQLMEKWGGSSWEIRSHLKWDAERSVDSFLTHSVIILTNQFVSHCPKPFDRSDCMKSWCVPVSSSEPALFRSANANRLVSLVMIKRNAAAGVIISSY